MHHIAVPGINKSNKQNTNRFLVLNAVNSKKIPIRNKSRNRLISLIVFYINNQPVLLRQNSNITPYCTSRTCDVKASDNNTK